jgi:uncharacterized membrane protein
LRSRAEEDRTREEKLSDYITRFTGSMTFVYVHAFVFGAWILVNTGILPAIPPFDPFPFVMLAMAASVEAIFLSTFVLISQNRMARLADRRAELDLQVNLLAEQEITRLIHLSQAIARKLGLPEASEPEIDTLKQSVEPDEVLEHLERVDPHAR